MPGPQVGAQKPHLPSPHLLKGPRIPGGGCECLPQGAYVTNTDVSGCHTPLPTAAKINGILSGYISVYVL